MRTQNLLRRACFVKKFLVQRKIGNVFVKNIKIYKEGSVNVKL